MPLNIYDQLNLKLKGKLQLKPCNDIKVIGYSKQFISIVGKVTVTCTHANTMKLAICYITDLNDTKILLGLNFYKSFDLVKIQCDEHCICKKVAVDILNETISNNEFPRGLDVPSQKETRQMIPVIVNTRLRVGCKAHIMELFPVLFEGIGTMKNAIVIMANYEYVLNQGPSIRCSGSTYIMLELFKM